MNSENNKFKTQGECLMVDARWDGHTGEFFNINPDATTEGRIANLRTTLIVSLFASVFTFSG